MRAARWRAYRRIGWRDSWVAVFSSFVYLIANGALDWGPVKRLRSVDPQVSEVRTSESTIRRVGLEGRQEPGAAA